MFRESVRTTQEEHRVSLERRITKCCSENRAEHTSTPRGQKAQVLNVQTRLCALRDQKYVSELFKFLWNPTFRRIPLVGVLWSLITFNFTEQASIAVMHDTRIRNVLGSSPGRTSSALTEASRDIPQPLQANSGIVPQLGRDLFFPNPFLFLPFDTVYCHVFGLLRD
jgi:hypothetical protein